MQPFSPIDILTHGENPEYITVKQLSEHHQDNFIELVIYQYNNLFAYGYKLKMCRIIRQKTPHNTAFVHRTISTALSAAKQDIQKQCTGNRNAKKTLREFTITLYNQLELFLNEE